MSAVTVERSAAAGTQTTPSAGWLVGPWFDLLLVANIAWPLLLLAQFGEGFSGRAGLQFWQVYYLTTPHRWITLAMVFLDRQRFQERKWQFVWIAGAIVVACLSVRMTTGTLACLLAIDYVWNAWHFAAQHHGIFRIYERLSEPTRTAGLTVEKWSLRMFLLYVILRVAGATWSNLELEQSLRTCDLLAPAVPVWLIVTNLLRAGRGSLGRIAYLISVSTLYLCLLWAVHMQRPAMVLSLATASALFHAIEYLALVGWAVRGRHANMGDRMGLMSYAAKSWTAALAIFAMLLGAGAWFMDQHMLRTWLLLNVMAAFMHYAYDGLIWRRRSGAAKAAT